MPQHKSAEKAWIQSEKRRLRNRIFKSRLKTEIKKFLGLLEKGDYEAAEKQLQYTQSLLHSGVSKGILHRNKAANKISSLYLKFNKVRQQTQAHS
ncbi:MAG: 30S ribosomal protein S20 [Caldimicrobium sp.]|nr:30S ribosomal protein S20 [Caldimicrobium sp.]MCX7613494.1 30S ribosomal protein S20 [Caldimicrobium sp.]MDW8182464.1 30S ribosomal protein S20 [Caldimicrobium sp.]